MLTALRPAQPRATEPRRRRSAGEGGFTLIELLVVVVIIGILIAIAIPVYLNYEKGAHDASAGSDVRNAIGVLELCNADNSTFPKGVPATGGPLDDYGCADQQINVTGGTTLFYYLNARAPQSFVLLGTNSGGSGRVYCYNSAVGGSVAAMPESGQSILSPAATAERLPLQRAVLKKSLEICLSSLKTKSLKDQLG